MPHSRLSALSALLLAGFSMPAIAQVSGTVGQYSDATVTGAILEPEPIVVSDDEALADLIRVPDGFEVTVVGRDLGNTRMLAVSEGGYVYATRRTEADVIRLIDMDGDGRFEDFAIVAARPGMHGIAIDGDTVYLATVNEVFRTSIAKNGDFGPLEKLIDDLPDGGQHPNRTLAVGPDGKLYISVGSTCNACAETSPESATLLRAEPDGSSRTIFASGLRNTIGFGWHPVTGVLWGADHGTDWLGDEEQLEEFNHIEQGKQFGWPYIYDFSKFNPQDNPPEGMTLEQWAELSEEPVLGYTAHAAPMQMVFHSGAAMPAAYAGDAFIAMRGSWNRRPPSGYEVTRVDFDESGTAVSWEHFAEGFLIENEESGYGFLARLAGLTEDRDGSLLLADDFNGIVYRISYTGDDAGTPTAGATPDVVPPADMSDIALNLVDTEGTVEVAADFTGGEPIPLAHAAEGDNASPPLTWGEAPDGTQSFVVIVDDPDAAEPKPFVHWVIYDIPGGDTGLREGLPTDPVLQLPDEAKQGKNSRGQIGYFGPRPPLGDAAHSYHFQVFAIDIPTLGLQPGASRAEVLEAMDGHVLGAGEVVGTYERPGPEAPLN